MSNAFIAVRNFAVHTAAKEFTQAEFAGKQIPDERIDAVENTVWQAVQEAGVTGIGRQAIRKVIVQYIIDEFGTQALGIVPTHRGIKQVDEDAYKRWQSKGRKIRKEMYGSKR